MDGIENIIEGCRRGDEHCRKVLYDRYAARFFALCRRYSSDDSQAEDALVQGFCIVFDKIEQYSGKGSFEGWMQRIFMHEALKLNARAQRRLFIHDDYARQVLPTSEQPSNDMRIDLDRILRQALSSLKPRANALFNMVAVDGYSLQEAAAILGMNPVAAKSLYRRTRDKLADMLSKSGLDIV